MNWYIAKIVFNITNENRSHTPQFDEQLLVRLLARNSYTCSSAICRGYKPTKLRIHKDIPLLLHNEAC